MVFEVQNMRSLFTVLFLWTAVRGVSDVGSYTDYLMTAPIEDILEENRFSRPGEATHVRSEASTVYEIYIWGPATTREGAEPVIKVVLKQDGELVDERTTAVSKLSPAHFDDGIHLFSDTPDGGWTFLYLKNSPRIQLKNSDFTYLPEVPGKNVTAPVVISGGAVEISRTYIYHNYHATKAGGMYVTGEANVKVIGGHIAYNKAEVGAVVVDGNSVIELEELAIFENEGSITGAVYTYEQATFIGRRVIFENQASGSVATGIFSSGQSASLLIQCEFEGRSVSEDYKSCLLDPEVSDVHSCGSSGDITSPVLHMNDTAIMTVIGSLITQQSTERGTIFSSGLLQLNVRHTNFTGNVAHTGGGLFIENGRGGTATILNCHFNDNVARFGGAMVLGGNGSSTVKSCTFTRNRAILGGAIWGNMTKNLANGTEGAGRLSSVSNISIVLSDFTDNTARFHGGALFTQWADLRSNLSSFCNNTAGRSGGAIYIANSEKVNITDTKFSQNYAGHQAGAIKALNVTSLNLIRNVFSLNTAAWKGGAFYLKDSLVNIQNSTFTDNYCFKSNQYEL